MSTGLVNLLLNWGPITYLIFVPFVMWALSRGGKAVYFTVLVAGALCAAGSLIRLVPSLYGFASSSDAIYYLHVGQTGHGWYSHFHVPMFECTNKLGGMFVLII